MDSGPFITSQLAQRNELSGANMVTLPVDIRKIDILVVHRVIGVERMGDVPAGGEGKQASEQMRK